jgi:hypothetical protein
MSGCTLAGNTAQSGTAIAILGYPQTLTASNCTLTGNTAIGGGIGSAIFSWEGHGSFTDCEITDNTGSGIQLVGYQMHFSNCVVRGQHRLGHELLRRRRRRRHRLRLPRQRAGRGPLLGREILFSGLRRRGGEPLRERRWRRRVPESRGGHHPLQLRRRDDRGDRHGDHGQGLDRPWRDRDHRPRRPQRHVQRLRRAARGTGNIDADPLWVDAGNGDYHLLPASPCIDTGDPSSPLDPDGTRADMGALPFENAFDDLGGGVPGTAGPVVLAAHSTLVGGDGVVFALSGTAPFQPTLLILGASQLGAPFKGGTLWPNPSALVSLMTNGSGQLTLSTTWPASIPSGFSLWAQFWHADAGAVAGFAGSNGVRGTVP